VDLINRYSVNLANSVVRILYDPSYFFQLVQLLPAFIAGTSPTHWILPWCSIPVAPIQPLLVLLLQQQKVATSSSDLRLPLQIAVYGGPFLGRYANIQLGRANLLAHSQYSLGLCCTMLVVLGSLLGYSAHFPCFLFDVFPLYCLEKVKEKDMLVSCFGF
jgi:hypothetical protein